LHKYALFLDANLWAPTVTILDESTFLNHKGRCLWSDGIYNICQLFTCTVEHILAMRVAKSHAMAPKPDIT